ncbi:GNAT family N-acetyltransferase [Cryptosporangium phraense]|uniref:GNAT family N-acetyltransferase n=1 Tax=Cryptosporangium phraense TaxID=2593070 RepID=A0A545ASG3_9ACTN|nr:GNAT family N-acetyltransferase [Cryptosporangium phraense]TQS44264.1 GNAT family N-acetyltransferase [Cryptosporangium phraense]
MTFAATSVSLRPASYDSPEASLLIAAVQDEYLTRYGGHDETPVDPLEFAPPRGRFVIARVHDTPVGCGGWRDHAPPGDGSRTAEIRTAEIKRMFVSAEARRRGIARMILADLERTAAEAGYERVILETGDQQPESVALYRAAGYAATAPFGHYAADAGSMYFAKML